MRRRRFRSRMRRPRRRVFKSTRRRRSRGRSFGPLRIGYRM